MEEEQLQQVEDAYPQSSTLNDISIVELEENAMGLLGFKVDLPVYVGHFDNLLELVEKQDVNICDISLTDVTMQYLKYISLAERLDLSVSSEFLYVASYLLERKSKELLPVEKSDEKIEEVETTLVDHVMQYRVFKKASLVLRERKDLYSKIFHRSKVDGTNPFNKQYMLRDVAVADLTNAFRKIWLEVKDRKNDFEIVDEIITVEEKIAEIREKIYAAAEGLTFESLFKTKTRIEVIVTFLAILELVRQKSILVMQEDNFGNILLFAPGSVVFEEEWKHKTETQEEQNSEIIQ